MQKSTEMFAETEIKTGRWVSYLATAIFIFLIQFPFLHLCNSFSDAGFHLTNQELANKIGLEYATVTPLWWFSDVVGGWWLKLFGGFGLWGAKFGGVAALVAIGILTASTLCQLYKPSLAISCAVAFAASCNATDLLNYQTVPLLFATMFSLYFLKLHLHPMNRAYPILCGVAISLAVFSRLPMILLLFIPVVCLAACGWFQRERFSLFLPAYLKVIGAAIACLIGFALFLLFQGLLDPFISRAPPSEAHYISSVTGLVFKQLFSKIPLAIILGGISYAFVYFVKKGWLSDKRAARITLGLVICNSAFMIACAFFPEAKQLFKMIWPDSLSVYLMLISANVCCLVLLRDQISFQEVILFLMAALIPVIRVVGSSNGFLTGLWMAGFLLCGLTVVLFARVASRYQCKLPIFYLGLLLSLFLGYRALMHLCFSDPSIFKATVDIREGRMQGIYTTPQRAENWRALIQEIRKYVKPGDAIFAGPYLTMVFYASGTVPLGNHVDLFHLDFGSFSKQIQKIAEMPVPAAIVLPRIDFQNPAKQLVDHGWPVTPEFVRDLEKKYRYFEETLLKRWNPTLAWSNDHFDIYVPPKKASAQ